MKKIISVIIILAALAANAQTPLNIHTNGRYLLGPNGDTLLLRGINYAPYNWGYDINSLEFDEIAKTGANVVRIPWYSNNSDATTDAVYKNYVALDSAISKCIQHKMVAIIEIHDYTCSTDTTGLLNLKTWWTQSGIFNILKKYKASVIVNYANEALFFNFASNPTTALATYKNTYQHIITALRNVSGFNFPIMIDAPDCGSNSDAFITSNLAKDLIQYDPQHNLIFSAHAYWYAFANNDSTKMAAKINAVLAQNIPLVLGEIGDLQDDANPCQYVLNYKPLLKFCQLKKLSWIAWSWDNDVCSARQVSSTGNFSNLTTYGNDIVNNPVYGLLTVSAPKIQITTGISELSEIKSDIKIFPNPINNKFTIQTDKQNGSYNLEIYNTIGQIILNKTIINRVEQVDLSGQSAGVYFIKIQTENNIIKKKIIKQN